MVRKNTRVLGVAPHPKHEVSTHGACNLGTQAITAAAGSLRSGVGRSEPESLHDGLVKKNKKIGVHSFPPKFSGTGGNGNGVAAKAVKAAAGSSCRGVG